MKSRKPLITVAISTLFVAFATTGISVAWFTSVASTRKTDNPIGGVVQDTYYESGTGVLGDPYIITRPRHLYNLAWLQDLGFYNKHDNDETTTDDHQYYFKLGADIDMSRFSAIPPIGTEENPFMGNFDGQGHTISGVTISNQFSDYVSHPSVISNWNGPIDQPHILGLFGVVGDYSDSSNKPTGYNSAVNELKNTGISNITIQSAVNDTLMGLAAGYVNATMSDVAVTAGTLDIPDVAGTTSYPIVNGEAEFTENISDHGLIGYTENKTSIKKVSDEIYDVDVRAGQEFTANWQGSNAGWGGSIDMNSIFSRLNTFTNNNSTNDFTNTRSNYPYNYTHKHLNGDNDPTYPNYPQDNSTSNQSVFKYVGYGQDDNPSTPNVNEYTEDYRGSIVYSHKEYTANSGIGKFYLVGGEYHEDNYYESYDESSGYRITDGSGNYLIFDGTGLDKSTDANCHVWEFETTSNNGVGYIRTLYEGDYYYLMNDGGALDIEQRNSDAGATDWTITINGNNLDITDASVSPNLKVLYYNNNWGLFNPNEQVQIVAAHYALMDSSETYYIPSSAINNSSTNLARTTTEQLYFYTPTNNGQVSCYDSNGTRYYLYAYYRNNTTYITARQSNPGNYYYALNYVSSGPYVRAASGSYYYYLRLNGNNWVCTRVRTNSGTTYPISFVSKPAEYEYPYQSLHLSNTLSNSVDYHREQLVDQQEGMQFAYDNTTYFPLNVYSQDTRDPEDNETIIGYANEATPTNTGYFVAGTTDDTWSGSGNSSPRSIIISSYSKTTKLKSDCYSNDEFDDDEIYTIDGTGAHALDLSQEEKYTKYAASKSGLETVLNTTNNSKGTVGGFHFYAKNPDLATPSMDSIVEARDVRMRGVEYRSYQLPVYSVDFYLKEQGRINFLAGMYNGGSENGQHTDASGNNIPQQNYGTVVPTTGTDGNKMNGFFSLFKVDRSGSTITNIRKIKAIYEQEDSNTYVYTYVDGKCTIALNGTTTCNLVDENDNPITNLENYISTNHLTLLFDAQWIWYRPLHSDPGRVYYFEIPVDEGEYCLGGYETPNNVEMDGAYLMYLDIGASAAQYQRTMVAEHFLGDTFTYSYPDGVALIPVNTINTVNFSPSNSVCFVVEASYRGSVIVSRDNANNVSLKREANYRNVAKPNYVSDVIVSVVDPGITQGSNDIRSTTVYESRATEETYRIQYYDYNEKLESLTKTIITDTRTSADGGVHWSAFNRSIAQQVDSGAVTEITSQMITLGRVAIFKYFGALDEDTGKVWTWNEISNVTTSTIYYDTSAKTSDAICRTLTSSILKIYHVLEGNIAATTDIKLELEVDGTYAPKIYYKFKDYIIIPTVTNGDVVYEVKSISDGKTFYFIDNGTTLTSASRETVHP